MEFEFNFLADLYKDNDSEPSLLERLKDTFLAICGILGKPPVIYRLGLYDYLFLGIPTLWFYLLSVVQNTVLRVIMFCVDLPFRVVVSLLFTLLALPFVLVVHFCLGKKFDDLIIPLINKKWRVLIIEKIEEAIATNSSTLCIDCENFVQYAAILSSIPGLADFIGRDKLSSFPGLTDFIIEELNKDSSITIISLENLSYDEKSFIKLGQNVNYIQKLEVPYDFMIRQNDALATIAKLKIKYLQFKPNDSKYLPFRIVSSAQFLNFCKQNDYLEILQCQNIYIPKDLNLTDSYHQAIEEEGVLQGCRFITKYNQKAFDPVNKISENINASFPIIRHTFEVFKIMKFSEHLDVDCKNYLCLILLQFCPDGIFEKNKKGFVKLIQAKDRFFSLAMVRPEPEAMEFHQAANVIEI